MMIFTIALLLGSQDKWLFEEKFKTAPGKDYAWVRQDAGASKVDKGALLLKALPGTIWEKSATQKNLLLRSLPAAKEEDGPLSVEAVVSNSPEADDEQAGIMLYQDDDTYMKLCRERVKGKLTIVFARELGGIATSLAEIESAAPSHRLRFRMEGQKVSAEVLPEGAPKWILAGYCEAPFRKPEASKAALYACGAPAGTDRWARFSEFRVGHPAPVDQ